MGRRAGTAKIEPRSGPKSRAVRLNISQAGRELGIRAETLTERLRVNGETPGEDGCYSLIQIFKAAFGDKEREQIEKDRETKLHTRAKRKALEMKWVPVEWVVNAFHKLHTEWRGIILASQMPDEPKRDILNEMAITDYRTVCFQEADQGNGNGGNEDED